MLSQFIDNIRKANRLIAGGMFFFDSPGHMLSESDFLLRLISHYPLIKARSPVVILHPVYLVYHHVCFLLLEVF